MVVQHMYQCSYVFRVYEGRETCFLCTKGEKHFSLRRGFGKSIHYEDLLPVFDL